MWICWWCSTFVAKYGNIYHPGWMRGLDLSFAVFVAGGILGVVNECLEVQIASS
jgi:hypothetical protein